jgi:hypothetical protein
MLMLKYSAMVTRATGWQNSGEAQDGNAESGVMSAEGKNGFVSDQQAVRGARKEPN